MSMTACNAHQASRKHRPADQNLVKARFETSVLIEVLQRLMQFGLQMPGKRPI
jgi:hypothetical protein